MTCSTKVQRRPGTCNVIHATGIPSINHFSDTTKSMYGGAGVKLAVATVVACLVALLLLHTSQHGSFLLDEFCNTSACMSSVIPGLLFPFCISSNKSWSGCLGAKSKWCLASHVSSLHTRHTFSNTHAHVLSPYRH